MSRYDVEKFEPPPDPELVCCICTFVLDQPMESPCQHVFCKHCIETWLAQRRTCPTCRKKVSKRDLKPVLPLVQNMLNKLTLVCDFRENGCPVKPTLEVYPSHIAKCDFELLSCRYSQCQAKILRRDISEHEMDLCEFREVQCLVHCGLHIPIKDMDTHDCMLALKKHAEERQKHAEELEARLKQLMTLQQSLRQDVEKLRRQVEQERRRRPSHEGWSSSSWDSWDEDDQNVTTFFESDSEAPVDNSQLSTDSSDSPVPVPRDAESDSDVENRRITRTWHRSRPLSVSSNNSDDLQIVEEEVPSVDNPDESAGGVGGRDVSEVTEFANEGEDSVIAIESENAGTIAETPSSEGGSGNQILTALDVVRNFVDSVFSQNQLVTESVDSNNPRMSSLQQLLQQVSENRLAFNGVSDLNLSSSTWEAVCRFLSDIVSNLLRLRTNQMDLYNANTPMSSTLGQNNPSDNISAGFPSSVAEESEIFNTSLRESETSSDISNALHGETWSVTDSSLNNSLLVAHGHIRTEGRHTVSQGIERNTELSAANILPITSDVTLTGEMCHSKETPDDDHSSQPHASPVHTANTFLNATESCSFQKTVSRQSFGPDDILGLLGRLNDQDSNSVDANTAVKESENYKGVCGAMQAASVTRSHSESVLDTEGADHSVRAERTVPSDDSCICISSTDDLEDGDDHGVSDINMEVIPLSYHESSQRYHPFQNDFLRVNDRQETVKRCHSPDLADTSEPLSKTRKKLEVAKDLLIGMISSLSEDSKLEQRPAEDRLDTKVAVSRPVSWTVTSAIDPVPLNTPSGLEGSGNGSISAHEHKKGDSHKLPTTDVPGSGPVKLGQQESTQPSGQRKGPIAVTAARSQECTDVEVPPRTAQLLVEYSEDSDSSWEPGNSDLESSDYMSLSEDVETDSSYEVLVPRPLYQIIDEMAAENEDSDDSWTPE